MSFDNQPINFLKLGPTGPQRLRAACHVKDKHSHDVQSCAQPTSVNGKHLNPTRIPFDTNSHSHLVHLVNSCHSLSPFSHTILVLQILGLY